MCKTGKVSLEQRALVHSFSTFIAQETFFMVQKLAANFCYFLIKIEKPPQNENLSTLFQGI